MINKKIENIIFSAIVIGLIYLMLFLNMNTENHVQNATLYVLQGCVLAFGVKLIYVSIRDKIFKERINSLIINNELSLALKEINSAMSKQNNLLFLLEYKILIFAFKGDVSEFFSWQQPYLRSKKRDFNVNINILNYVLSFILKKGTTNNVVLKREPEKFTKLLYDSVILFQSELFVECIEKGEYLITSNQLLYKCIGCYIVSLAYEKNGNFKLSKLYFNKMLEYSPSEEITSLLSEINQ